MSTNGKIESGKLLVRQIFTTKWFSIPVYQRPYVWKSEDVSNLLEDLTLAMTENPENTEFEYFFGSFVFQSKAADPENGQKYPVNELLDGQQRMATLLMLFAVIRDLACDNNKKKTCQMCIFQEENEDLCQPELTRLVYVTHPKVTEFINDYIRTENGTINEDNLKEKSKNSDDLSVKNMANAVLVMRGFFRDYRDNQNNPDKDLPTKLLSFLLKNVLFIYVSTENLEDAFRLFRVLNDRGARLRSSDILKATNLAELKTADERIKYAEMWEDAEGGLGDGGDGFERFLNYVRTILVKEKQRLELIDEFEKKIYTPEKLQKGQETFERIEKYLNIYRNLLNGEKSLKELGNHEFNTLLKVMQEGLLGTDWMAPLLRYFEIFKYVKILDFIKLLDIKYSADWIGRKTPTDRIMAMIKIIEAIDSAKNVEDVLDSDCFDINKDSFIREIEGPVYGKRFARYLLLKLDYFCADHTQPMHVEKLSVEHILPQNPAEGSNWMNDFKEQRAEWTHKIGNLVLVTGSKDSRLGRLEYPEKKEKYFSDHITNSPRALHVYHKYDKWTPKELKENQEIVLGAVRKHYKCV